jgi:hypothetical protein
VRSRKRAVGERSICSEGVSRGPLERMEVRMLT